MANEHKFSRLDPERKELVRIAIETMYTRHLRRSYSSDSIGQIIDAIDENYQHLNISRTLSRKESLRSQEDDFENEQEEAFLSESN
jgi:hypothetical protein